MSRLNGSGTWFYPWNDYVAADSPVFPAVASRQGYRIWRSVAAFSTSPCKRGEGPRGRASITNHTIGRTRSSRPLERVVGHADEIDRVALAAGPFGIEIGERLGRHRLLLGQALGDDRRHAVARRRQHVAERGDLRLAGDRAAPARGDPGRRRRQREKGLVGANHAAD